MDARAATDVCGLSVRRSRVVLMFAVLALSPGKRSFSGRRWQKSRSPGRARISRKAIAQGRPGCFRRTCMLVCALSTRNGTRDRGCGAHPVFPAPSHKEGGKLIADLGRNTSRECKVISTSLRGAKRRSNPSLRVWRYRLLRFARNDGGWLQCAKSPYRRRPRKWTIQYPRESDDGIEKPRRTGCPGFAGHDDHCAARLQSLNPAR